MSQTFRLIDFDTSHAEVLYQFFLDIDISAISAFWKIHFNADMPSQSYLPYITQSLNHFLYDKNLIQDFTMATEHNSLLCCIGSNTMDKTQYTQLLESVILHFSQNRKIQCNSDSIETFFDKQQLNNKLPRTNKQQAIKI